MRVWLTLFIVFGISPAFGECLGWRVLWFERKLVLRVES
jgi:hypothetical protein